MTYYCKVERAKREVSSREIRHPYLKDFGVTVPDIPDLYTEECDKYYAMRIVKIQLEDHIRDELKQGRIPHPITKFEEGLIPLHLKKSLANFLRVKSLQILNDRSRRGIKIE